MGDAWAPVPHVWHHGILAYHIARTEHFDQIQIRRVARALGVWPQALYRYVPSKSELLRLVMNRALETRRPPGVPATAPWDRRLLDLFERTEEVLTSHPGLAQFLVPRTDLAGTGHMGALAEDALALLFEGGMTPDEALGAFTGLASLIVGRAQLRAILASGSRITPPVVDAARFPRFARTLAEATIGSAGLPTSLATYVAGLVSLYGHRPPVPDADPDAAPAPLPVPVPGGMADERGVARVAGTSSPHHRWTSLVDGREAAGPVRGKRCVTRGGWERRTRRVRAAAAAPGWWRLSPWSPPRRSWPCSCSPPATTEDSAGSSPCTTGWCGTGPDR